MKKILLSISIVAFAYFTNAQVIVAGVSPSNIVGNYANTWAEPAGGDWTTPNFLIPGTYIQDTLIMSNDGSVGLNAQGNPVSAAACNPVINNLNGKIAVIYRGDGTTNTTSGGCEFGLKALNAQNAGAIGVIIINREPGVMQMVGGASGATVTIPVVMLSNTDGAILVNQMLSGPVVVFIGNKIGLFANDIRLSTGAALAPKQGFVPALLAQNATEFNFSVGARIYNDGNQAQGNVSLRATVTNPAGNLVYDNSVSAMGIDFNDSIDVAPNYNYNLPDFSLSTYPVGTYTLTYTASLDLLDEYASDNSISYTFTISESIYSAAKIDTATGLPSGKTFYRPTGNVNTYSICSVINNPNASRLAVEGLYFAATKGTAVPGDTLITGEEMNLTLYKWEDVFIDLNDPNLGFNQLTEVAQAYFYYTDESQEGETVYGAFAAPVVLEDNQRYLACVQTVNINIYLGHDNTNYTWNTDYYLQPISPIENDGTWFAAGFGVDVPNAVGIKVISSTSSVPVTFKVDMTQLTGFTTPEVNGSFNGWCGATCNPMTDANSDGIWEATIALMPGDHEYKFAYDNWAGFEELIPGSSCTVTNSGFTNRFLTVSLTVGNAPVNLNPVCYGLCTACSFGQNCSDLYISEYVEGSGNNKALEIYNPTASAIDLSGYRIERFTNGSGTSASGGVLNLIGTIAPYSAFVITNGQITTSTSPPSPACDPILQAMADQLDGVYPAPTYMNGNDAIALFNGSTMIDLIGKIGDASMTFSNGWGDEFPYDGSVGAVWTENHTLVRKATVQIGVSANPTIFIVSNEWDSLPQNTWSNLGTHVCSCISPTSAVLSGDATICAGSSTNLSVAVTPEGAPYTVTVTDGIDNYSATGVSPVSIPVSPSVTSTYTIVSVTGGGTGTVNSGAAIVTITPSSTNTTSASACGSYTWNGQTYSSSGLYTGTTANCVTQALNLTITPSSTNTTSASACGSYTWNGQTYSTSGVYTGTTANCVTQSLNLTITPSSANTTAATACDSYTWNGQTYSSSGVYTGTTANCVTQALNLTITPSSTNTTTASACNSYVWNGTTYTASGVYSGTTANCVTQSLNLTITPSSTNTTAATACDSYAWNGQTYTQSGVYTGATANCVTQFLNLSITPSSTITQPASQSINISNNAQFIVGSSGSNAIYQWQTDLGIGFQNLNSVGQYSGTSNNTLTVSNVTFSNNNQPFRCIVSSGSCTDTSDVAVLTVVNNVGFNDLSASKLSIYPNPTNGDFTITGLELLGSVSSLTLTDMNGKVVKVLDPKATKFSMSSIKPGVYFLNIISGNKQEVLKIVKE